MIANMGLGGTTFGSGCLLDDLVKFVYQGHNDRLLLIGDKAQLPPVGEEESPALSASVMEGYGLKVYECDLNEVLRQSQSSGILYNATLIRQMITHDAVTGLPLIRFKGFADIVMMPGAELVESLGDSYHHVGMDETMVITRSNKRANIYNNGIRNMVLDREEELSSGDMLMIVKNNYFWTEKEKKESGEGSAGAVPAFLANGDRAKVLRVSNYIELYGFRLRDAGDGYARHLAERGTGPYPRAAGGALQASGGRLSALCAIEDRPHEVYSPGCLFQCPANQVRLCRDLP